MNDFYKVAWLHNAVCFILAISFGLITLGVMFVGMFWTFTETDIIRMIGKLVIWAASFLVSSLLTYWFSVLIVSMEKKRRKRK